MQTQLKNYYIFLGTAVSIYTFSLVFGELLLNIILKKKFNKKDSFNSIYAGLVAIISQGLFKQICILPLMLWVYNYRLFNLDNSLLVWIACIALSSFLQFYIHYLYHRVRLFWCFHVVHHSATEMNFATSIRSSVIDIVSLDLFYLLLPLLGFHPLMYYIIYYIYKIWGVFIHISDSYISNNVKSLNALQLFLVTPLLHRIHHASNKIYVDKNYSEFFTLYDYVFKTYAPYSEPIVYGLEKNQPKDNFIDIQVNEFALLKNDLKKVTTITEKLKIIFYPPSWYSENYSTQSLQAYA